LTKPLYNDAIHHLTAECDTEKEVIVLQESLAGRIRRACFRGAPRTITAQVTGFGAESTLPGPELRIRKRQRKTITKKLLRKARAAWQCATDCGAMSS